MRVGVAGRGRGGGVVETILRVERAGCEPGEVRFRVPEGATGGREPELDFAVPLSLLPAMRLGERLEIEGEVDGRLLEAVPTLQDIYAVWGYGKRIELRAGRREAEVGAGNDGRGVACFFTGGADSWYTVMKHRLEITHLVYVHGFDVGLEDAWRRGRVSDLLRQVGEALGKGVVEVETDLRTYFRPIVKWDYHHGGALAAVALLMGGGFRKVFIPGTFTYADLIPLGSHPMLDPLWSTKAVEIVHDGCEASRLDKVRRIQEDPLARKLLRVCWRNVGREMNCGVCEKCVRTRICLEIVGGDWAMFPGKLDYRAVARLKLKDRWIVRYRQLKEGAEAAGKRELAAALEEALAGKHHRGWRGWMGRLRG